jgi:ribonuclease BN (tRNA processing enzyme)
MKLKLQGSESDQKDKYELYLQTPASPRDNVFSCLRGWSSSVTLLEGGNDSHWRGGGYFLKWQGRGIVIDPGFDFIDNFHDAEFTGKEISAVLVSHNHSDHNYDLRSLDDLRYELHRRWITKKPEGIVLGEYAVVLDEDTLKGFDVEDAAFRKLLTFDIKKSVRKKWLVRPVDIPLTVEHFPVEHGEDVSHAVGMRLVFHSEPGGRDFIVGYTGDTEYFDVLSDHLRGCDVLIAHISMPDAEELGDDQDSVNHLKKRHLGLNGTARLIQEAKPKLTLIGEFWAGRADIRIELIQALRKRTGSDAILPTGIGFHLHLPTLDVECTNCEKRVPYDGIRIAPAASAFGPLGYLCANCFM